MPGSTQSACAASAFSVATIVSREGHNVGRRFGSNEIVLPAARISFVR